MKLNHVYRTSSNVMLTFGSPLAAIAFTVLGLQTYSAMSQLAFSAAAVSLVFSALIYLPYFMEKQSQMRIVLARRNSILAIARHNAQRRQYYTLSKAMRSRGISGVPAWVR